MTEPKHYELGGSNIERWWNCPASVRESRKFPPSPSNKYSAEGTAAHTIASQLLIGYIPSKAYLSEMKIDGFEIEVTQEMLDYIQEYVDYCLSLKGEHSVEEHTEVIPNEVGGTLDHSAIIHFKELHINDFKYGQGTPVYANGNKQLMSYALGKWLKIPEEVRRHLVRIWLTIYQPRIHGKDSWCITPKELEQFHIDLLKAVERTKNPDAEFKAGDWCKYCPAKLNCPALKEKTLEIAFPNNAVIPPAPNTMPIEKVLEVLDYRKMIEDFLESCAKYAKNFAEMGGKTPGRQLITTYGNRKWKNENEAMSLLDVLQDHAYIRKLKSPAQIEKIVKALKLDIVMPEIIKPETGKALVKVEEIDHFEGVVIDE